jgi:hypothetical protein
MKKLSLIIAAACIAFNGAAYAQIQDITVNNGISASSSDYAAVAGNTNQDTRVVNGVDVNALGYVDAGDVNTKDWDLEAFGYQSTAATQSAPASSSLTYIGGFNPLTTDEDYNLGDIFLSQGTATVPQTGGTAGGGNSSPGPNTPYTNPGYAYAIHITGVNLSNSTLTYNLYQLNGPAALVETVSFNNYQNNPLSDPYALDLNGTGYSLVNSSPLTATVSLDTNHQINQLLNENIFNPTGVGAASNTIADNYVVAFDISSLNLTSFNASLTEQCGNDLLAGSTDALMTQEVPEPSTWALLLGGLGLLAFWRTHARSARI